MSAARIEASEHRAIICIAFWTNSLCPKFVCRFRTRVAVLTDVAYGLQLAVRVEQTDTFRQWLDGLKNRAGRASACWIEQSVWVLLFPDERRTREPHR